MTTGAGGPAVRGHAGRGRPNLCHAAGTDQACDTSSVTVEPSRCEQIQCVAVGGVVAEFSVKRARRASRVTSTPLPSRSNARKGGERCRAIRTNSNAHAVVESDQCKTRRLCGGTNPSSTTSAVPAATPGRSKTKRPGRHCQNDHRLIQGSRTATMDERCWGPFIVTEGTDLGA